jgi:hypothetical protein
VNVTTGEQEDFTITPTAWLVVCRNTVGGRVCREWRRSLLTRVTTLAAPGRLGDATPHLVTFDYNANSELVSVLEHPEGVNPRARICCETIGRVVAVGTPVDTTHTDWSCAEYTDELRVKAATSIPQSAPSTTPTQMLPFRSVAVNAAPTAAPTRCAVCL